MWKLTPASAVSVAALALVSAAAFAISDNDWLSPMGRGGNQMTRAGISPALAARRKEGGTRYLVTTAPPPPQLKR
jgi:hypothetical protein